MTLRILLSMAILFGTLAACDTPSDDVAERPDSATAREDSFSDPGGCLSVRVLKSQTVPPAGVRVSFNITTCSGDPVPDLSAEDISFLFDGDELQSEGGTDFTLGEERSIGLYTYLLLDASESIVAPRTGTPAFPTMMDAASAFVDVAGEVGQRIGVFMFGGTTRSEEVVAFTGDYAAVKGTLAEIKSAAENRGSTNLYGAFREGAVKLRAVGDEELQAKSLVLFTDGEDETRTVTEQEALAARGSCQDIQTYVIGLQGDYNGEALRALSCGEGSFVQPEAIAGIEDAFEQVANRINALARSNYVVGVCSPREGAQRSLTLRLSYNGATASVEVPYDATGFDLVGCDPSLVADPCAGLECGVSAGVICGMCVEGRHCRAGACVRLLELFDWVTIPGGSFQMGSEDGDSDERPVHPVTVSTFEIARTEVTQGQWEAVMGAGSNPSAFGSCGGECPVETVTWYEAVEFCNRLSDAAGLSRCYSGSAPDVMPVPGCEGYRLPTESEWEYAARSGGQDIKYPWGNTPEASCEYAVMSDGGPGCGRGSPWPVCSKPLGHTAQGLCDMAGNVWEWVEDDWHDGYDGDGDEQVTTSADHPRDGTAWVDSPRGSGRVFRGGSWYFVARLLRAANRAGSSPGNRFDYLGFRPARSNP